MMTLNDMAAVFAAASEGKEIQWAPDPKGPWEFIDASPRVLTKAAADGNFLRVKPVAQEWWLALGDGRYYPTFLEASKINNLFLANPSAPIHVREVID